MDTLATQLQNFQNQFRANVPAEILEKMNTATEDLINSDITNKALKTGDQIPLFTLSNQTGAPTDINQWLGKKPFILTFYRGGWCPYCNLQLRAFQNHLAQIQAHGAELIAITPELPDSSLATSEKNELEFTVLSDEGNKVAKEFGIVFELAKELQPIYKDFGIHIDEHNGDNEFLLPLAATYVVDKNGTIVWHFIDADYTKRASIEDLLAKLKSL